LKQVLVDTGFLVALGIQRDPRHSAARDFLAGYRGELLVPAPVIS
jgi:predicted nucleic acid-binding protein